MTIRTTKKTLTFARPFVLGGVGPLPPGSYDVETDEELVESLSFPFYRRVATMIHLRRGGATQVYLVDPTDLEACLVRDVATAEFPASSG